MVNQPQGHNSIDSSAALLQQQHNFDVQVSLVFDSLKVFFYFESIQFTIHNEEIRLRKKTLTK